MRNSGTRRALLPAAACTLLALPLPVAGADVAVEGSNGNATVGEILGRTATFRSDQQTERKRFQFYMPPGAKQGPDTWYTIRLVASATFARETGPGSVLVSASTNGRAAAQVEFYAGHGKDGQPITSWDSVDAFNGNRSGRSKGRSAKVRYENVLQFSGVKPGLNTLGFETETFGDADLDAVRIEPASGVYATPEGPAELQVSAELDDGSLEVGEAGDLEVRISSSNSRDLRNVAISVQPRSSGLFIDGPATRRVAELGGEAAAHFVFGASRPGPLRVQVGAVAANGAEASTSVSAEVGEEKGGGTTWLLLAGLGLLGGVGAAWAIRHHRRRQGAGK